MARLLLRFAGAGAALLLVIALGVSAAAAATSLGGKLRSGDTVLVPANETVDSDLYAVAGSVTVDGTIHGDLVAGGGTVIVNGTVDGDIIVGGGTLELGGNVGRAIRAGGGQVTVSGTVAGDVLVGSGTLVVTSSSRVGGDLIFSAGTSTMNGTVAGSVVGRATTYDRGGSVGGTEDVTLAQPAAAAPLSGGNAVLDALRHFLAVLLFGALGLWLLPRGLRAADETIRRRSLLAFASGLGTVLGFIVLVVVLVVVMIALAIGFGLLTLGSLVAIDVVAWLLATIVLIFGFYLSVAFVGDAVVGLALGRLLMPGPAASRWRDLGLLAIGAAAVVIVTTIPYLGPLAKFVVVMLGLGGLAMVAWSTWRPSPTLPVAAVPAGWGGTGGPMPPAGPVPPTEPPPSPVEPPSGSGAA